MQNLSKGGLKLDTLYEIKGKTLIIYMPTELDHHNAELITEHTDWFVTSNNIMNMVFDFKNTQFMDSSGIGVVMGRYKLVKKLGGKITLKNISEAVNRIFSISGVYKILENGDNKRLEII